MFIIMKVRLVFVYTYDMQTCPIFLSSFPAQSIVTVEEREREREREREIHEAMSFPGRESRWIASISRAYGSVNNRD